jgi:hypothetical protein
MAQITLRGLDPEAATLQQSKAKQSYSLNRPRLIGISATLQQSSIENRQSKAKRNPQIINSQ